MSEKEKKPYGFCQKCGHPFTEEDVFCEGCGADLSILKEIIEKRRHPEEKEISEVVEISSDSLQKRAQGSRKNLIFGVVAFFFVIGIFIGGKYLVQFFNETKSISDAWGQTYYVYLDEMKKEGKEEKAGIPENMEEAKLNFYEITGLNEPVMVLSYVSDGKIYSNIYYIHNGKVNTLTYQDPMEVELLYHIESSKYSYYTHTTKGEEEHYNSISRLVLAQISKESQDTTDDTNEIQENPDYTFQKGEVDTVTDEDGTKIEISKFDMTFVKVENGEDHSIDYHSDLNSKELKKLIVEGTDSYQPKDSIVTKDVQNDVDQKVKESTKKQEEIKQVKEKIAAKGFKVGDHYLKYGKYQSSQAAGSISGGFYTLNSDGTFVYENTWENLLGERTTTKRTGTYEAKYSAGDMMDPKECWIIIFRTQETNETYPQETDVYDVLEDNKFTARQYPNTWTPVEE